MNTDLTTGDLSVPMIPSFGIAPKKCQNCDGRFVVITDVHNTRDLRWCLKCDTAQQKEPPKPTKSAIRIARENQQDWNNYSENHIPKDVPGESTSSKLKRKQYSSAVDQVLEEKAILENALDSKKKKMGKEEEPDGEI